MLKLTTDKHEASCIISCFGYRYTTAYNYILFCSFLFGVFVHAAGRHKQTFAGASPAVRSTLHGRR